MDNIYIDYEQGMILGTEINQKSKDLKTLLTKLNEIEEKLKNAIYESNDDKYLRALLTQTKIMYKLSDVVDETGKFLINVSKAYKEIADASDETGNQEE